MLGHGGIRFTISISLLRMELQCSITWLARRLFGASASITSNRSRCAMWNRRGTARFSPSTSALGRERKSAYGPEADVQTREQVALCDFEIVWTLHVCSSVELVATSGFDQEAAAAVVPLPEQSKQHDSRQLGESRHEAILESEVECFSCRLALLAMVSIPATDLCGSLFADRQPGLRQMSLRQIIGSTGSAHFRRDPTWIDCIAQKF